MPGLNPFAAPSVKKLYGDRPWAQSGNGVIVFSAMLNSFAGPSVSRQAAPQNTHEIIPFGNIFKDMDYLLSNPDCRGFISDLIKKAEEITGHEAYSYDARELIQTIATETHPDGGYFLYDNGGGQGSAWGDIWAGTAAVSVETRVYNGPPLTAQAIRDNQLSVALVGLHETIHGAGGGNNAYNGYATYYTDYWLARSVFSMFKNPKDNPDNPANLHYPPGHERLVYDYGAIWDQYLQKYCLPARK